MKILLIYPYFLESRQHTADDVGIVPQGVYYIAAVLKKNHYDVEILNWHNIHQTPHKIKELLNEKKPAVIGFSIVQANRWGGIEIARIAKNLDPQVHIVFGGIGATFLWEHFLSHFPEIDFVVIGEGEYPFLNLIRCLEGNASDVLENIPSLAFRKDGKAVRTRGSKLIDNLDELPNPAEYFTYQHVSLTRGCAGSCSFCGSPRFWGRSVRFHSTGYFVEQLERLYNKGIRFFYFSDDTLTVNKERVIEICGKIIEKQLAITWAAISRVDYISEKLLYWMRKAGCIQISYGVESGSEKIRNFLQKKISHAQIQKAFVLTRKYGIMARAYFIYGCRGENAGTIQESIDLINAIKPLSVIFYILDIFPGTALYEDFKQRLKVTDDFWLKRIEDILYFETDPALTREMILNFGQKLRSCFYDNLPRFVQSLQLVDKKELFPLHADFYSRLGFTFDQGDYAGIEAIRQKTAIAEQLYRKALEYDANPRAYLGLGILYQKKGDYRQSVDFLAEGLFHFPADAQLHICMGFSLMNLQHYEQALAHLLKFENIKEAMHLAARCCQALGDEKKAVTLFEKLRAL